MENEDTISHMDRYAPPRDTNSVRKEKGPPPSAPVVNLDAPHARMLDATADALLYHALDDPRSVAKRDECDRTEEGSIKVTMNAMRAQDHYAHCNYSERKLRYE